MTPNDIKGSIVIGVITLLLAKGFEWFREWLKDRREREQSSAQTAALTRIAESNEQMRDRIGQLNTHLEKQEATNTERHAANIRSMDALCKANCANYREVAKQK